MKYLKYDEPDENGNNITIRISEQEAIRQMKAYATSKGHVYPNDKEALVDFIVINWAEYE